eukprot:419553_1
MFSGWNELDSMTKINKKVKLLNSGQGKVKYIGEIVGKTGVFYGIDLQIGKGKNDGSYNGMIYFKTRLCNKNGIFVKKHKITKVLTKHPNLYAYDLTVGDKVEVFLDSKDVFGVIRSVGIPSFNKYKKPMFGIELHKPFGNCNGTYKHCTYFTCSRNRGIYIKTDSYISKVTQSQMKAYNISLKKSKTNNINNATNKTQKKQQTKIQQTNLSKPAIGAILSTQKHKDTKLLIYGYCRKTVALADIIDIIHNIYIKIKHQRPIYLTCNEEHSTLTIFCECKIFTIDCHGRDSLYVLNKSIGKRLNSIFNLKQFNFNSDGQFRW